MWLPGSVLNTKRVMKFCSKSMAHVAFLGLVACTINPPPQIDDELRQSPEFAAVNPTDIAVLPVEDVTDGGDVAPLLELMRNTAMEELITRNYTPLSATMVDASMQVTTGPDRSILEAAYLSTLVSKAEEDAILALQISKWDDTTLLVDNRVRFEAQVTLLGSKDRQVLWTGRLVGDVEAGGMGNAPRDPQARAASAAREFIKALISRLPKRKI